MLRFVTLAIVAAAAPTLADGSWFAPLFTAGNSWALSSDTKVPFTVHATVAVRALKAAQVASVTFTADAEAAPKPDGDASPRWVPTPLCLARSAAGLFVVDDATCGDKAVLRALKGKPVMTDPPKAFTREVKGHADDVPLKESVEIAVKPVLERKLKVASYAFSQDSGFTMALAEDLGFVSLGWDLQDGGGSFALSKFERAAPATPPAAATWEQLGIDPKGRTALEAANGALSVSGEIAHENVTIALRGTAAQTELVVTGSDGREQFTKTFKKRPPRGLRYEPATGDVSLFFDLGAKLEQTAKTLKWNPHSHQYLISAHTEAAE